MPTVPTNTTQRSIQRRAFELRIINNLKADSIINFKIICINELGIGNNIDIKAHIVNIKYNLIIGLETIKENNLTIRYPSIFSSNNELDGLICKPCAKD